jgi:Na+-transporting NADH:ubiquinone oxidoreductase subunit B
MFRFPDLLHRRGSAGPTSRAAKGRGGAIQDLGNANLVGVMETAPHIRDGMNLTRAMNWLLLALLPCVLFGVYNSGYQANATLMRSGLATSPGWRGVIIDTLGIGHAPASILASVSHGLLIFLPILAVAMILAAFWENLFATLRRRSATGDYVVVALLFALSLPPTVPLWQVALGVSFGVVVGREIFGGTGRNFLNPPLTGLAFLYVTYPAQMVGETAWAAVDGLTGATPMQTVADGGMQAIAWVGSTWMQSFLGLVPGAIGATSTLAAFIGAAVLIRVRIASARILTGILMGMIVTVVLFNQFGDPANAFAQLSWHWHLVLGSFAFGAIFMATDPVSAAMTSSGKWIYGFLIGAMLVVIRVTNATHPDGVMFAILFGNILAPLIDYLVIWTNIRRRARRDV